MLATPAAAGDPPPAGAAWTHEVKWDGMRVLADVSGEVGSARAAPRLTSRNDLVVTAAWPDVVETAPPGRDLLVDGELIALNERGVPDFRVLQERMHVRRAASVQTLVTRVPVTFMVFDLLRLDGAMLLDEPLERRRGLLVEALGGADTGWQVPPAYDDGAMLLEATLAQGLEGIVSKRLVSRYRPGERSAHWLKRAHRHRGSYVVGGWRPQEGSSDRLAALLVGEVTPDGLAYRGRVGSGIAARQSRQLTAAVAGLTRAASPFHTEVPGIDARGTTWLEPRLVVDVDTHGVGYERLRQPSFRGLRTDLSPEDL